MLYTLEMLEKAGFNEAVLAVGYGSEQTERLLDEKTIQNAVSYGIKKGILDAASISIPPNAKFDQLSIEQRKALIDILKVQNKNNSFLSTINKGIDYCDYLLDMVITDGRCQEDLENDN